MPNVSEERKRAFSGPGQPVGWKNKNKERGMLKKYIIERDIKGVGAMGPKDLGGAASTSNRALSEIDGIQWQMSYVTANKTFCVYFAENEGLIRKHAELSGFPANKITEVTGVIDPSTEQQCPIVTSKQ